MKHFKTILLSLMLVFTYNQVNAEVKIELGEQIDVTNKSECIKAIEKGKLLRTSNMTKDWRTVIYFNFLHKGFLYYVQLADGGNSASFTCWQKRSLGN